MKKERLEYEFFNEHRLVPSEETTFEPWDFHTGVLPWQVSWYLSTFKLTCLPLMENPAWIVHALVRVQFLSENKRVLHEIEISHKFDEDSVRTPKPYKVKVAEVTLVKFVSIEIHIEDFANMRTNIERSYTFTKATPRSNCVLIAGERKFNVNLDVLAMHSIYFNELRISREQAFNKEFPINLQLNKKEADCFPNILSLIFYEKEVISKFNVYSIAELAKKFQIETVLKQCEEFLVNLKIESTTQAMQYCEMSAIYGFYSAIHCAKRFLNTIEEPVSLNTTTTTDTCDLPYLAHRVCYKGQHFNKVMRMTTVIDWAFKYKELDGQVRVSVCPVFANRSCHNWEIDAGIRVQIGESMTKERFIFSAGAFKHLLYLPFPNSTTPIENSVTETNIEVFSARGVRYHMALEDPLMLRLKDKTSTVKLHLADGVLYSNLAYLAHFSDYFKTQLKNAKDLTLEDDLPVILLNDVNLEAFRKILLHIYPGKRPITLQEMKTVIPLADRLLFSRVLIHCEKTMEPFDLEDLQLAMDYRMFSVNNKVKEPLPSRKKSDAGSYDVSSSAYI